MPAHYRAHIFIHIYGHMGWCSLREARFCGVPSRVFDKLGYATGEKVSCGNCALNVLQDSLTMDRTIVRPLPTQNKPRSGHVEFVVDKVALGQVFSEYFGFPCQSSFHQLLHNHPHLSSGVCTIGQKWPQYLVDLVPLH
jgi:hypothetical protein